MADKYILFKGSMNPKSPMAATDNKLKELSSVGYKQGKDYDVVSLKVLEDMLGKAGGGIMDIIRLTAPLGYRTGGSIGTYELTKEDVDLLGMDPSIIESGENIISKDSDEYRKLMEIKPVGVIKGLAQDLFGGLGQLFGGRGAEGSELPPEIELELLNNQLRALQGLPGSTLLPSNQDQIKKLEDRIQEIKIDLYKSGQ